MPLLLVFLIKMLFGKSGYSRSRLSRFSLFDPGIKQTTVLWHCVSVGEVACITPLVNKLLASHPDITITITTTTATGAQQVISNFGTLVQHCYLPYDCGWLMRRLLTRIYPKVILITEVELWPNLINIAKKRCVKVALINARMTDRSAASYAKLVGFFSGTAEQIDVISAQSQKDKDNYERLGINQQQVVNNGNIKFELSDKEHNDSLLSQFADFAKSNNRIIIVGASTHEPEEQMMINAHAQLVASGVSIETWIVPRHPQRFDHVAEQLESAGIDYQRYSQGVARPSEIPGSKIVLIDAMGVLNAVFSVADMAFVGGSFADKGGHNALEAAQYKLPVVMGPSQFNNPAIYQALKEVNNLKTAHDQTELNEFLLTWCRNPEQRIIDGNAGHTVIKQNRGALAANFALIESLLGITP